ncbi:MAG: hypothetical protein PF795_01790 [Kiritimatiellae bacterium]|nr:hypothetical protein [Kiritimatiellia bacterium]
MNLTSLPPHSLLASVLAAVLSLSFVHGDTLVADNFNSLGNQSPLHGRTPSTTTSGIQNWIANSGFSGDVSGGLGNFVYGGTGTVEIPPLVTGNVYEYNLDVLVNDIGTAQWLGLGFMDLSPLSSSSTIANVSSTRAAMFLRGNGEVQVYSSAGNVITSTGAGFVTPGQSHTLRLVVDTTVDGAWTFAAYAGGTQLDLNPGDGGSMHYTYSGNQSLSRVAISASSSVPAGSYVDNMSLEMNPEAGGGGDYKSVLNVYNNWRVWGYNWQSGDPLITSLSNTFNTTENGGTSTTFAFSDPVAGVDVQDPNHPDFQTASDSNFGYSSTHSTLGVGHATTGRFTRGDSFILTVGRKFQFQKLAWRAISANADLHLAWTQDGNPQTLVLPVEDLMDLSSYNVVADAGTDIVFTNVADVNEYTNDTIVGFKYFTGWLMFDTEPAYDFSGADGLPQMFGVNIAGAEFDGHSFLEALDDPEQWAYYESKGIE